VPFIVPKRDGFAEESLRLDFNAVREIDGVLVPHVPSGRLHASLGAWARGVQAYQRSSWPRVR
jgi:hypothetical protein